MVEIKGRKFEDELAELIMNNDEVREMFVDIYTYEIDEEGVSWS